MAKILLVDDEFEVLERTRQMLEGTYELLCATSARDALSLCEKEKPDLVLTDFMMLDITGFEMLQMLQDYYLENFPAIFMTENETEEADGREFFHSSIVDFITKPVEKDTLLYMIEDILAHRDSVEVDEITVDRLTGFLYEHGITEKFPAACRERQGTLMIVDLDSFKLINDLYGYETGDTLLGNFADILKNNLKDDDLFGRVGGDEFVIFTTDIINEGELADFTRRVNQQLERRAHELLSGEKMIPIGASVGAVFVPKSGTNYDELYILAEKSLEMVKQNGKHGYVVHHEIGKIDFSELDPEEDMRRLSVILEENNDSDTALWLNQDDFGSVYRFLSRFLARYQDETSYGKAYKVLFTIIPNDENMDGERFEEIVRRFGDTAVKQLRKSDLMMQSKNNQFLLLLPVLDEKYVNVVIQRIKLRFFRSGLMSEVSILHTEELADFSRHR